MLRSELVAHLQDEFRAMKAAVERAVNIVLDEIAKALARGSRIELRSFGVFSVRARDSRMDRNPRTGAAIKVAAKCGPFSGPLKNFAAN